MLIFHLVLVAAFAGYTASFVCVVVERRSRGERPDGRSRCVCGAPIPLYRNIPVVTWLVQRGRAACCGARIPRWYVASEAGTVVAGLAGALGAEVAFGRGWLWPGAITGTGLAVTAVALSFSASAGA